MEGFKIETVNSKGETVIRINPKRVFSDYSKTIYTEDYLDKMQDIKKMDCN